ncbi:hypothetical protein N2152v2_006782 [Parachlorella kessleri]
MRAIQSPPSRRWLVLAPYNYVYLVYLAVRVLGSAVEVNNGTSWLAALHDDEVDFIVLTGSPNLTNVDGPLLDGSFAINLSHLWPVITVGAGATLAMHNILLTGLKVYYDPDLVLPANATQPRGFIAWPSINAEPGAQMGMWNVLVQYPDPNCSAALVESRVQANARVVGSAAVGQMAPPFDTTYFVRPTRTVLYPVFPVAGGESLGSFELTYGELAAQCYLLKLGGQPDSDQGSSGGGSSSTPWWVWLIVGMTAAAALVSAAAGLALWVRRRRAPSTAYDSKLPSAELKLDPGPTPHQPGPTPDHSGQPGQVSPRAGVLTGPESTLKVRFGDLGDLELGNLIGKGGERHPAPLQGREAAGWGAVSWAPVAPLDRAESWTSVNGDMEESKAEGIVHLVVVEHSMPSAAGPEGGQGCLPWESVLGAVVSHPNIITTYRVRTVELRRGGTGPGVTSGSSLGSYPTSGLARQHPAAAAEAASPISGSGHAAAPAVKKLPGAHNSRAQPVAAAAWGRQVAAEPPLVSPAGTAAAGCPPSSSGDGVGRLAESASGSGSSEPGSGRLGPPSSTDEAGMSSSGLARASGGTVGKGKAVVAVPQEALYETWLVLEYCDKGSLADNIRAGRFLSRRTGQPHLRAVLMCLADVARGMVHLHSQNIVHGDLKAANVLMKSREDGGKGFTCKIADLGLSRLLDKHNTLLTQTVGTLGYMPPEVMSQGRVTTATDVYSFGVLMYELAACRLAFMEETAAQIFYMVVNLGERPVLPERLMLPPGYAELMQRCWAASPEARPAFAEVLKELETMLASVP